MTPTFSVRAALQAYFERNPHEQPLFPRLAEVMELGDRLLDRNSIPDHWTASAWVVEPSRQEALLLFHRKLQRWIQPGGHADGNPDLPQVALREAREETGLKSLRLSSREIFDFDVTPIPARKDIPAHNHLDVRFLLWADRDEPILESEESDGVRWVRLAELSQSCDDQGVAKMAAKTRGPQK
ncbi:MAG: NUDIX hydrolase [Terracidiphilus sp.]